MTPFKTLWFNKNYLFSLLIALFLVAWLASGAVVSPDSETADNEADREPEQDEAALTEVRARDIEAQDYPRRILVTGHSEAERAVTLRAELEGTVEALPVAEGGRVDRGEVICELAVDDRAQRLEEAQAAVQQAELDYKGARRLESDGYQSRLAIAGAKATLEAAKANLVRRQLDLENTQIRAPFAGIVDDRPVEEGDLVRPGDNCATVIDLQPLVLRAEVSEDEVDRIADDAAVDIRLASGQSLEGRIRYVARRASEAIRTYRVEAVVENPGQRLRGGMTADMRIHAGSVAAHEIPASVLGLDEAGELGVRTLDQERRVEFHRVEMVGDSAEGVWVTGLPPSTRLITVGQEYVGLGEQVSVNLEDAPAMGSRQ